MKKNTSLPKKKIINIGVIGNGRMANFHLKTFARINGVNILSLCSTPKGKARRELTKKKFKIDTAYGNYKAMIKEQTKLDGVIIASSIEKNYEIAKYCIEQKKHCLIEKPPGLELGQVKKLISLSKKHKVISCVGLQRRFYGNFLAIKKIINKKKLQSVSIEAPENFSQILKKKKFSKTVLDKWIYANAIHCIDLFRFFNGEIKKIFTFNRKTLSNYIDLFNSTVIFKNKTVGTYHSNWFNGGRWSLRLYFKDFMIESSPLEDTRIIYRDGKVKKIPKSKLDCKFKPGLYLQNLKFINSIRKNKIDNKLVDLNNSYQTMKICSVIAGYKK